MVTKILIRVRIADSAAEELRKVGGIAKAVLSQAKQREIIENHAFQAEQLGKDAFRGNRTDAAGNRQADSGKPRTGWGPTGWTMISFDRIMAEMKAIGFNLIGTNIIKKAGDHMSFLYLNFADGEPVQLSKEAEVAIQAIMERVFEFVHVFDNPDRSITINPSHSRTADCYKLEEINHMGISMDTAGSVHFSCVK
ncbi:MAG: hypothetical protein WCL61_00345 [bacterium]